MGIFLSLSLRGCSEPVTSGRGVARIVGPRTMSAVHRNFVDSNFWPWFVNLWFWRYLLVPLLLMFVIRSPYGCWGRGWEPKLCPWSVVVMIALVIVWIGCDTNGTVGTADWLCDKKIGKEGGKRLAEPSGPHAATGQILHQMQSLVFALIPHSPSMEIVA